jgi:hypothetical protein
MAEAAHVGLKNGGPQTAEFYKSKIATADFYYKSGLPPLPPPCGACRLSAGSVQATQSRLWPIRARPRCPYCVGAVRSRWQAGSARPACVGGVCATLRARLLPRTLVHAKTMTTPTSNLMNTNVRVCSVRTQRSPCCVLVATCGACLFGTGAGRHALDWRRTRPRRT